MKHYILTIQDNGEPLIRPMPKQIGIDEKGNVKFFMSGINLSNEESGPKIRKDHEAATTYHLNGSSYSADGWSDKQIMVEAVKRIIDKNGDSLKYPWRPKPRFKVVIGRKHDCAVQDQNRFDIIYEPITSGRNKTALYLYTSLARAKKIQVVRKLQSDCGLTPDFDMS